MAAARGAAGKAIGLVALRLTYVEGVSPAKWLRAWADRRPDLPLEATRVPDASQLTALESGDADLAFVRLPVPTDGLHAIPLWEEVAVVVAPKDHAIAAVNAVTLADLDDEPRAPVQPSREGTIELVAAGTGVAIVPHSIARLHHRRDVVAVPVTDAPTTRIALVWRVERDDADIQEFVGVVRGRTARSSRGAADEASDQPERARDNRTAKSAKTGRASRDRRARRAPGSGRDSRSRRGRRR
ncbi:LysR family transcriptional regulator substrate-binding protein [Agromyces mangrovi Wang et al. 2018]|uniref:LysR family transcriptional regulator substrate-binding protein n=1 Tax=Agromyces mangrovi TaxID=1858653 RepID=UPI00257420A3|nr:LysR family transcriptional regulator substrate-binding protein [Agromyces mangrovi]BDZ63921.1 LysR family transcriptional regulator [Agromyces mangrovi]